jgi:hypothetical protein
MVVFVAVREGRERENGEKARSGLRSSKGRATSADEARERGRRKAKRHRARSSSPLFLSPSLRHEATRANVVEALGQEQGVEREKRERESRRARDETGSKAKH